jgi:hypothetical protein
MSYPFRRASYNDVFAFESIGAKTITKMVSFYEEDDDLYILSFHDLDGNGNPLPFTSYSDNGDAYAVLATVAEIMEYFLTYHPGASLIFSGSDDRRTEVYHKLLVRELEKGDRFDVEGLNADNTFEPLNADTEYSGYIVFLR